MKKKHICILSAGTANGYALIQQLRKKYSDQVKIYSADIGHAQWMASANLADEHLIVPRVDSNQYQANMNSIFQKTLLIGWFL